MKEPQVIDVISDTGAEVSVAGIIHLSRLGIKQKHLRQPIHELKHVGGGKIHVLGSCKISIELNGKMIVEEVYFVTGVTKMFLSLYPCKRLHIVPRNLPAPVHSCPQLWRR